MFIVYLSLNKVVLVYETEKNETKCTLVVHVQSQIQTGNPETRVPSHSRQKWKKLNEGQTNWHPRRPTVTRCNEVME